MKKTFKLCIAALFAAFALNSCEDVPAPYNPPTAGEGSGEQTETIAPAGTGTAADPYNVAGILAQLDGKDQNTQIGEYYVKGVVIALDSKNTDGVANYGNMTYDIADADDSKTSVKVFQSYYLNKQKYTSVDQIQVGDTVVVYSKWYNYMGNTPETTGKGTAYLTYHNGKTGEGGDVTPDTPAVEPKGDGTEANPYNVTAILPLIQALAADEATTEEWFVTGTITRISSVDTGQYGNATYYISDVAGGEELYIFRSMYLNNTKFTNANAIKEGDVVVIRGLFVNYKGNTPETVTNKSYLVSINGSTEPTEPTEPDTPDDPSAGDIEGSLLSNGGFEVWSGSTPMNWKTASTAGNATLKQSTDAHSGSYSVEVAGSSSSNKRLGYQETELAAGSYTMTFYVKAATAKGGSVRPGYAIVTDGKVSSGSDYIYGSYTNDIPNTEWVKVTHSFTLETALTVCPVIMNAKNPGANILVDDFVLVKD